MKNQNYPLYQVEKTNDLKEMVEQIAEKYKEASAFIYEQGEEKINISYQQFKLDVDTFGMTLLNLGIQNEKVALIGENSYEWILTYFSVINTGNVIVPLDRELPIGQIDTILVDCGATTLIFSSAYADVAENLRSSNVQIQHFINLDTIPELLKNTELTIRSGKERLIHYKIDHTALAAILYTSGTTGRSKGVMLSHKNLAFNATRACQNISFSCSSLLVLPLHHSFAFTAGVLIMLLSGTSMDYLNMSN